MLLMEILWIIFLASEPKSHMKYLICNKWSKWCLKNDSVIYTVDNHMKYWLLLYMKLCWKYGDIHKILASLDGFHSFVWLHPLWNELIISLFSLISLILTIKEVCVIKPQSLLEYTKRTGKNISRVYACSYQWIRMGSLSTW